MEMAVMAEMLEPLVARSAAIAIAVDAAIAGAAIHFVRARRRDGRNTCK
jgi:glutamate/tyrosine decarboxylase-like PLP-dependent enzyme